MKIFSYVFFFFFLFAFYEVKICIIDVEDLLLKLRRSLIDNAQINTLHVSTRFFGTAHAKRMFLLFVRTILFRHQTDFKLSVTVGRVWFFEKLNSFGIHISEKKIKIYSRVE